MSGGFRRFMTVFAVAAVALVAALGITGYVVDPYQMHSSADHARAHPGSPMDQYSAWGKTYAIWKLRPATLYLGSSRVEIGLPVKHPAFDDAVVFNAALSGGTLGDSDAMARHALAVAPVETVVLGLDFWAFKTTAGNPDFDRTLVASDIPYGLQRFALDATKSLSSNVVMESFHTLTGSNDRICNAAVANFGQRDPACIKAVIAHGGGTRKAFERDVSGYRTSPWEANAGHAAQAMPVFERLLDRLCERSVRTRVFIQPMHALNLQAYRQRGGGPDIDDWKIRVTDATMKRRERGCDIRLFDFSGYNSITTDPVPHVSGSETLRHYWEGSHYREEIGRLMLNRMFEVQVDEVPADFGRELTPATVGAVIEQERQEERRYVETQASSITLLREWLAR